jgi:putative MATE family efflux protein
LNTSHALGEKSISKLLWDYSAPAITGMMVNALYNIVDSIFVGHGVGAIGLAAVTVAFPIMLILMAFGMLIGIGATTLISIRIGEQKKEEAEKILGNAFILVIILTIMMTLLFELFLDTILVSLGAEPDVLPYARDFTHIIIMGSVFMLTGFGLNNIIRAEGHPKTAMMTMIISAVLNTILNPLFIFVLGLGIQGSALATVLSQAVSAVWVFRHFMSGHSLLKLRVSNLVLNKTIVINILTMGSSAFFMQIAASVVAGVFNFTLQSYGGQMAIAAMGVVNRVSMLILMPLFGISQGVQPIIGYNYGARNYNRVIEALKQGMIAATVISIIGFIIIEFFDIYIIRLFNTEPELIALGAVGLRIYLFMLPIIGFQVVGSALFQAIGKPTQSLLLSMSRQLIILIPVVLILPRYMGLQGVWLAGPIADLGSSIITGVLVFTELKNLKTLSD